MKLYKSIIYTVLLLATLLSCSKDRNEYPDEIAEVRLTVPAVTMRGGVLFTEQDEKVAKVRVLIFNAGGGIDAQKLFIANTDEFANPFHMEAHVGNKNVYVIANEPDALKTQLDLVVFESDLMALTLPEVGATIAAPLTMVGEVKNITLVANTANQTMVALNRVVAKITLDLKQDTDENVQLKITKATIDRLPKQSTLFPKTPFALGQSWIYTKSQELLLTNKAIDFAPYIADNTLYVYENIGSVADTLNRAPRLTVTALFNGIETTYHAYVNDETSTIGGANADHHFSLRRNHHYKLEGTITKLGNFSALLLNTKVLPWEVETLQKDFLEPKILEIVPQPALPTNYTSVAVPLVFDVKIKATEGKRWRATVTNSLEFEVVHDGTFVSEGDANGVTTYRVKVIPRKPASTKLRTTELYFVVDNQEIVLPGSTPTDRTTRIHITQKANA